VSAKRFFDMIVALCLLGVLAPVFLVLTGLIRLKLGSPVFFRQWRPGRYGQPFSLIKFRSMVDKADAEGRPLPDAARLTAFGRLLRASSLDELPELVNVLKGEMSLVGPRPLLMHYLPLYSPEQARRHEVRPGVTGLAQVNGRNAITWDQKFSLDVWYVDNRTFWLDLCILWRTLIKVLRREGISSSGEATMPAFTGSVGMAPSSQVDP